jgi:hypothetical protein
MKEAQWLEPKFNWPSARDVSEYHDTYLSECSRHGRKEMNEFMPFPHFV